MLKKNLFLFIGVGVCFAFIISKTPTPYVFRDLYMFPPMPVSGNNPVTNEGALLGKYLFYDPILSLDSSFSCSSCHHQKNAFSDAPNQYSKGIAGGSMNRNTLPLFNLAWSPEMFWDGRVSTIEQQVFHPVRAKDEMNLSWKEAEKRIAKSKRYKKFFDDAFGNQKIDSVLIAKAVAQFLRTLISSESKFDKFMKGEIKLNNDELKGYSLFTDQTRGDCLHCHAIDGNALGTTSKYSNNGLDTVKNAANYKDKGRGAISGKPTDNGKFRIPTVRNVALTAPYMHDGRFKTLEEVLDFYSEEVNYSANIDSKMEFAHKGGAYLSDIEKKQIISFLQTLTDSAFILNKEFSNPYSKN